MSEMVAINLTLIIQRKQRMLGSGVMILGWTESLREALV